ncbi:uncharacterized protein LOC62_01G001707 [Vanrija pseudolonga]|uniref:Uncharacterized protein n=1 Tax=Vanrija pseudolonga TaxID=143232 RepID=A0AAF0Y1F7_9TREE|nr:hypothetical protein LOC62_01G001707 [Vanrija pseudolonga]
MILTSLTALAFAILASASAIPREATEGVELEVRSDPVITFKEYDAYQCYGLPISWSGGTPPFYLELGAWDLTPGAEYPFVAAQTFYPVFFKNLVWNIPYPAGTKIGVILNQGDWTNGWTPTIRNTTVLVYLNFWAIDTTPGVTNPWVPAASLYFPGNVTTFTWDVPCVDIWFGESSTAVPWKTLKVIAQNATVLDPAGSSCATSPTHFVSPSPSPTSSKYRPSTVPPSPTTTGSVDPYPDLTLSLDPWPPRQCEKVLISWTFSGEIHLGTYALDATPGVLFPWINDYSPYYAGNVTSTTWNVPWGAGALVKVQIVFSDSKTHETLKTIERNGTILDSPGRSCSIVPTHYVTPAPSTTPHPEITVSMNPWPPHQCKPVHMSWTFTGPIHVTIYALDTTPGVEFPWIPDRNQPYFAGNVTSWTWNVPWGAGTKVRVMFFFGDDSNGLLKTIERNATILDSPGISCSVAPTTNTYVSPTPSMTSSKSKSTSKSQSASKPQSTTKPSKTTVPQSSPPRSTSMPHSTSNTPTTSTKAPIPTSSPPPTPTTSSFDSHSEISPWPYPVPTAPNAFLEYKGSFNRAVALFDIWGNYQFLNARPITGTDTSCIKKK